MDPLSPSISATSPKKSSKISDFLYFLRTHKKILVVAASVLFLFAVIIFLIFETFKNGLPEIFRPKKQIPDSTYQYPQNGNAITGAMQVVTDKTTYSVNEIVKVRVFADSKGNAITAFDAMIRYDSDFLTLTEKASPTLPEYKYFTENDGKILTVFAVQKDSVKEDQIFSYKALFQYEFKTKKAGKTSLNLIRSANSFNESNLLNRESKDLLSNVYGKDIEIK